MQDLLHDRPCLFSRSRRQIRLLNAATKFRPAPSASQVPVLVFILDDCKSKT